MTISIAKFPFVRTLEGFELNTQPSLDQKQVRELVTCRWVANGDAMLLLGPPGVGKTHLAVALDREAIDRGYSVLFSSATSLVATLAKAHLAGRLEEKLSQFSKPKLVIVDELGYLPLESNAAHLFFQLVSRRYERGSAGKWKFVTLLIFLIHGGPQGLDNGPGHEFSFSPSSLLVTSNRSVGE